ncbi:MAG: UbiA family prenyltransferase [Alphaproteobacteria bacterium]|nr:UbiA family prenyltransferase [Alphaproteobacteria bacterium]
MNAHRLSLAAVGSKWGRSIARSMDTLHTGPVCAFLASARLSLWPAIVVSSLSFSYALTYDFGDALVIALNLCGISTLAFLFNDVLDHKIDEANCVHRWSMKTPIDAVLLSLSAGILVVNYALTLIYVAHGISLLLLLTAVISLLYSVLLKRVLILGNLVAAGLSICPGLLILLACRCDTNVSKSTNIDIASAFLAIGFVIFVSREIRFDEFDQVGDRLGRRLTLPMVFQRQALGTLHILLLSAAVLGLVAAVLILGHGTLIFRVSLALVAAVGLILALGVAYKSGSKTIFYKVTRVIMLLVPVLMILSV